MKAKREWSDAMKQARRVSACKTPEGKRRAALRWCRLVLDRLGGTNG